MRGASWRRVRMEGSRAARVVGCQHQKSGGFPMNVRRTLLFTAVLQLVCAGAWSQTTEGQAEASLRSAMTRYVEAWNSHDVAAWSAHLTDDVWYTEAIDYYQRSKGKQNVLAFHGDSVKTSDIVWQVKRVKIQPDSSATVVLVHTANILPKSGDKYASTFVSDPAVSRWRLEGAQWKLYYFTSHKGTALDVMGKDGVN
jgi:ketosteroid isomerase-like protein